MKHDIENLVREAQTGNSKAFAEIYGFYAEGLYRFALYFTGNSADAEDCVQDAVLSAFKNIASLKKASSFKSWIFKILSNVCREKLKNPADRLSSAPIHEIRENAISDNYASDAPLSAEIKEALGMLQPDERQIVLLSVIGRYKSGEIAKLMNMTSGSVRSKLSRSLKKLRDILQ